MPVKVRCRECEAVLNIPDEKRGKTVACPKCKAKIKVPDADGDAEATAPAAAPAPAKAAKAANAAAKPSKGKAAKKEDTGLDFGKLNLDDVDHEDAICPYCAEELDEDDPVCRSCGMNVETGQMDRREKKKRERKGPDPLLYYTRVWPEAWAFMWEYKGLALKSGMNFMFFSVMLAICSFMGVIWIQEQMPPKVFWCFLTAVFFLGIPGWYFALSMRVIQSDMFKEHLQADRIFIDTFQSVSAGLRAVFWPIIVMMPLLLVIGPYLYFSGRTDQQMLMIVGGSLAGLSLLMLPLGQAHIAAKYSYKGWILWELIKVFFKNIGPAIYWVIVTLIVFSPIIGMAAGVVVWLQNPNPFASPVLNGITAPIANGLGEPGGAMYYLALVPMNIAIVTAIYAPIAILAGFPALFSMKANGLLVTYNGRSLDLVQHMPKNTPATFWVRFLSHTIDTLLIPFASFIVTANAKAMMFGMGLTGIFIVSLLLESMKPFSLPIGFVWALYSHGMYWIVQESSNVMTTLGKDAFGLLIMTDKTKQLTMQQAAVRWFLRLVAFYSFIGAAFHPQRKALHDLATNTKVVWKGDR